MHARVSSEYLPPALAAGILPAPRPRTRAYSKVIHERDTQAATARSDGRRTDLHRRGLLRHGRYRNGGRGGGVRSCARRRQDRRRIEHGARLLVGGGDPCAPRRARRPHQRQAHRRREARNRLRGACCTRMLWRAASRIANGALVEGTMQVTGGEPIVNFEEKRGARPPRWQHAASCDTIRRSAQLGRTRSSRKPQCPPRRVTITCSAGGRASRSSPSMGMIGSSSAVMSSRGYGELGKLRAGDGIAVQVLLEPCKFGKARDELGSQPPQIRRGRKLGEIVMLGPCRLLLEERADPFAYEILVVRAKAVLERRRAWRPDRAPAIRRSRMQYAIRVPRPRRHAQHEIPAEGEAHEMQRLAGKQLPAGAGSRRPPRAGGRNGRARGSSGAYRRGHAG